MGSLSVVVTAVGKLGPDSTRANSANMELDLHVSGMTSPPDYSNAEFVTWFRQQLAIGDEIVLRLIDVDSADAPTERRLANEPNDEQQMFQRCRDVYMRLRAKYEPPAP
jgi:hypothetical protein